MIPVSSDDELWKSGKSDDNTTEANEEEDSTLDLSSPSPDDGESDDLDLSPLAIVDKESSVVEDNWAIPLINEEKGPKYENYWSNRCYYYSYFNGISLYFTCSTKHHNTSTI